MRFRRIAVASLFMSSLCAVPVLAQRGAGRGNAPPPEKPEPGIPVTDSVTIARCSGCHHRDDQGNLARISWERTTPEGWEEAIKRMVRLNGLSITPDDARHIVKYLATDHGLAPEEAKPVMYIAEHRIQDETNIPNDTVRGACVTCHAFGRPMSWRRSKDDWRLLANLHIALYPQADAHFRRFAGRGGRGGGSAQQGDPLDTALNYLAEKAPLHTPEWAAWRARMRAPKLAGRWLVSAHIPGRGEYFGEMVIEPGAAEDEFATRVTLKSAKDGTIITRSGHSLVYAGYSWRGRSSVAGAHPNAPDDPDHQVRETMWFAPDQLSAEGRWFWGEYQEFGYDVKMQRASSEPTLVGVDRPSLKTGSEGARIRVFADNLPSQIAAADLDFGAGVKLRRIVSHNASEIVAEVDVDANAVSGKRDVVFKRSVLENAIAVYDRVDYIKVVPDTSIARLGSDVHPKGYEQFEALAYQRGADNKNGTADDVELGPVDVTWSVEEFITSYGDDDKDFVGKLNQAGLFTPASDGPDPLRKFSRNNYGEVWVVATAKNEKDKDGKPLIGRSYLVVSVPTYIMWDQPEVSQ
ncbi:MAG TPA: quinohemoprotein amine dehydrogenase subunit alpha [Bryobacteraceae bacterium]|nr:quinohemoprotein amine dehydrogenase subunit alpha [Bryobacteraceae bacterium]